MLFAGDAMPSSSFLAELSFPLVTTDGFVDSAMIIRLYYIHRMFQTIPQLDPTTLHLDLYFGGVGKFHTKTFCRIIFQILFLAAPIHLYTYNC